MRDKNFLKQVKELPHLRFGNKIYNLGGLDRHIPTLITKKMFRELDRVFDSACIALYQGVSKAHSKVSSDDNNQTAILWIRFEYLKNSVLWYNSSVDYILQIIYFFFCFYRVEISPSKGIKISSEITNKKSYEKCLRNCSWTKINEIFNRINAINNLQPDQILELTNFHDIEEVS